MATDGDHHVQESRKVQITGGTTYTVSLPKEWARDHGVEAGTEVGLRANGDGTLLVQAGPTRRDDDGRRVVVDVDSGDPVPFDLVVRRLYLAGHDEFALVGDRATCREGVRAVEAAANDLLGLTVDTVGDEEVVLRNALDAEDVSLQQTLLQISRVACEGLETAVERAMVDDGDTVGAGDRTAEVERLFGVVQRSFRRSLDDHQEVDRLGEDKVTVFDCYRAGQAVVRATQAAESVAGLQPGSSADDQHLASVQAHVDDVTGLLTDATESLLSPPSLAEATALVERCDRIPRQGPLTSGDAPDPAHGCRTTWVVVDTATNRFAQAARTVAGIAVQRVLRERTT
jgi:phosphate uptake regulator